MPSDLVSLISYEILPLSGDKIISRQSGKKVQKAIFTLTSTEPEEVLTNDTSLADPKFIDATIQNSIVLEEAVAAKGGKKTGKK